MLTETQVMFMDDGVNIHGSGLLSLRRRLVEPIVVFGKISASLTWRVDVNLLTVLCVVPYCCTLLNDRLLHGVQR